MFKISAGCLQRSMDATTMEQCESSVDEERFKQVEMFLSIQEKEAVWWKDTCLLYFQTFSKMPILSTTEKSKYSLDYYKSLRHPFAQGIGGNN